MLETVFCDSRTHVLRCHWDRVGIQPWNSSFVGAMSTGFMVREGPRGSYEIVHHMGTLTLRMNSWRLFPHFRWMAEALTAWVVLVALECVLICGCSIAINAQDGLLFCLFIPLFFGLLFWICGWVNVDYGVGFCGGPYGFCLDRQWVRFEPSLDPSVVARAWEVAPAHPVYGVLSKTHLYLQHFIVITSICCLGCLCGSLVAAFE